MTGAGEHVEALPGDKPPLIVVPLDAAAGRRARSTASSTPATRRARPRSSTRRRAAIRAGAPSSPSTTSSPPPAGCARAIDPALRGAARGRRRAPDGHRLRPDRVRHQRRPRRARAAARRGLPARRGGMKYTWLAAAVVLAGWLIVRRHKQKRWLQVGRAGRDRRRGADRRRRDPAAELRAAARGRRPGARQVDLPRRRRCSRSWRPARSSASSPRARPR